MKKKYEIPAKPVKEAKWSNRADEVEDFQQNELKMLAADFFKNIDNSDATIRYVEGMWRLYTPEGAGKVYSITEGIEKLAEKIREIGSKIDDRYHMPNIEVPDCEDEILIWSSKDRRKVEFNFSECTVKLEEIEEPSWIMISDMIGLIGLPDYIIFEDDEDENEE